MRKINKESMLELIQQVRTKLAQDAEPACGIFWTDEVVYYILPPEDTRRGLAENDPTTTLPNA